MRTTAGRGHGHGGGHGHGTDGRLLDRGWRYDVEVWFFDTFLVRGRIAELRRRVLEMAGWGPRQSLLDVGCGTGTLAIKAARMAGDSSMVVGIDPAPRQIARARSKARRARVEVDLRAEVIESLSFPDETFDVVTSTLMLHHLPDDLKHRGLTELQRVLKGDGCLVLAEFETPGSSSEDHGSGGGKSADLRELIEMAGFAVATEESIRFPRTHRGWSGATILRAVKA